MFYNLDNSAIRFIYIKLEKWTKKQNGQNGQNSIMDQ